MASYAATRTKDAIVITLPFSAIVKSIQNNPGRLAVDSAKVLDIEALAAEIVENINGSNALDAIIECEVGEAVTNGSKAVATTIAA